MLAVSYDSIQFNVSSLNTWTCPPSLRCSRFTTTVTTSGCSFWGLSWWWSQHSDLCDRFSPDADHFCPPGLLTVVAKTTCLQGKPHLHRPSTIIAERTSTDWVSAVRTSCIMFGWPVETTTWGRTGFISPELSQRDYDELLDQFLQFWHKTFQRPKRPTMFQRGGEFPKPSHTDL